MYEEGKMLREVSPRHYCNAPQLHLRIKGEGEGGRGSNVVQSKETGLEALKLFNLQLHHQLAMHFNNAESNIPSQ